MVENSQRPTPVASSHGLGEPRFLTRTEAAWYLGVSARTFDSEVAGGMWPGPMRRGAKGGTLTWDRKLLDHAADRLGGIVPAESPVGLDSAEQAALEAASRGTKHSPSRAGTSATKAAPVPIFIPSKFGK
jgi:hypothetical protein